MSRLVFAIVGLIFVVNASAQGTNSPQALANAVASAISSGKSASLAELFSPETNVNSKKYAIQDFMAYKVFALLLDYYDLIEESKEYTIVTAVRCPFSNSQSRLCELARVLIPRAWLGP